MLPDRLFVKTAVTSLLLGSASLFAQNALLLGTPQWDPASYTSLALKVPVTGDANYNATVNVRFRQVGTSTWRNAMPLFRVRPDTVLNYIVSPQFGGSIFDLRPNTSYEVELQAVDTDGGSQTLIVTGATRQLPQMPATPRFISANPATFQSALNGAQPGDVITLQDGVYTGNYGLNASGTAANPIIIRGNNRDRVIFDGLGCVGCVQLWIASAGNVQVERITFRNAERAIRLGATNGANYVLRRLRTTNVPSPIFSLWVNQVTVADSVFECMVRWPLLYPDDSGASGDKGNAIYLGGSGHIIAHNRFMGTSNSVALITDGSRAHDIYGNDFQDVYDNAVEPDGAEGNVKIYRNRFTNAYMPLSFQPVHGGPMYAFRNEGFNIANQQFKMNAQGGSGYSEPSGVLAYHNSFVSGNYHAFGMESGAPVHNSTVRNNLFYSNSTANSLTFGAPVYPGMIDYNAYFPDNAYLWLEAGLGYRGFVGLNAVKAANSIIEAHGVVVDANTFARGSSALPNYQTRQNPQYLQLSAASAAANGAQLLPNINDNFVGSGPDIGAYERGCALPWYGPRPEGTDDSNQRRGCETAPAPTGTATYKITDTTTKGTWPARYGSHGYVVAGGGSSTPGMSVSFTEATLETWQSPSTSIRAPRRSFTVSARVAAAWTNPAEFYVNVDTNGAQKEVALYFLEWAAVPNKRLTVDVVDANGTVLDTRSLDNVTGGVYLTWNVTGRVSFRIWQNLSSSNAVLSGVFFGPPRL